MRSTGIPADIGEFTDNGITDPRTERVHAAGIKCIGVASHHFDVQQLCEAGADNAIASLQEALPV